MLCIAGVCSDCCVCGLAAGALLPDVNLVVVKALHQLLFLASPNDAPYRYLNRKDTPQR